MGASVAGTFSHWPLVAVCLTSALVGGALSVWLLRRVGRAMLRRPQPDVGMLRYALTFAFAALAVGVSLAAAGLLFALQAYDTFSKKTLVAEVQCIEMGPGKLRLFYVPIEKDGHRGATETYDLEGDEWAVGADVMRFKPFMTVMGLETVHRVTRVEGKWIKAADTNTKKPTAFDRSGGTTLSWLAFYKDGKRGPLGWFVDGVHGQAVSQLPDRKAVYDLAITPNGLVVNKRSF
jgi:hypothetical protein